ncbi:metal-dependent transcriptional regulator [Corynebacterium casei]|uniref:Diphtheria toxin repressor n=1 Tax=Corynebacterium casei LMG S-19264 TaxID=1285583 RepID=A0ABM5PLW5_9CORY|nr:metal-dependent transcriptional regulator [Corynebacterium casei]AHI18854.1 Mn-dependent transcriptional regulator [Corynebacterium casei LMG S-19264]SLM88544.1 Mn-dependent transcriptional regulator MntR [Corynebacterium casei]HCJ68020.1 metal-dependent transcriptional regulator [Corynebacterium casei]
MVVDVSQLSSSNQDYVKDLFKLGEWNDAPITTKLLSQQVGVSLSSASDAVRRLEKKGLVKHAPYGAITLSELGREYALQMVRRHRLIETFLVTSLNYRWDQVHDEAEQLEHSVSDFMIDQIDASLGYPTRDPHGDPIPSADGQYPDLNALDAEKGQKLVSLAEMTAGEVGIVERIHDADPDMLKHFAQHGLVVGADIAVGESQAFAESTQIILGKNSVSLGAAALRAVLVRV